MGKKYVLVKDSKQQAKYLIGNGIEISVLEATTMEDAIIEAVGITDDDLENLASGEISFSDFYDNILCESGMLYTDRWERYVRDVRDAYILEVTDEINLGPIIMKIAERVKDINKELENKKKEEFELEEFERLKKKFGLS